MILRARIELLATRDGGRDTPFIGDFRPNHLFTGPGFAIGTVLLGEGNALFPGESRDLAIHLLPEGLPALTPGLRWQLWEGPHRLIGHATLIGA